jgi:zinc-binding alcohol dehydrogenase family protein
MLQRGETSRYWQTTLRYATEGNLQAVLDEYAHLLWEPAAWEQKPANTIAATVTQSAVAAITTKTSTVRPDYYRSTPEAIASVAGASALRTHFALRYGGDRGPDLLVLEELTEAGTLTPVLDQRYRLDEGVVALQELEKGHARGKSVVVLE